VKELIHNNRGWNVCVNVPNSMVHVTLVTVTAVTVFNRFGYGNERKGRPKDE